MLHYKKSLTALGFVCFFPHSTFGLSHIEGCKISTTHSASLSNRSLVAYFNHAQNNRNMSVKSVLLRTHWEAGSTSRPRHRPAFTCLYCESIVFVSFFIFNGYFSAALLAQSVLEKQKIFNLTRR